MVQSRSTCVFVGPENTIKAWCPVSEEDRLLLLRTPRDCLWLSPVRLCEELGCDTGMLVFQQKDAQY